MKKIKWGLIGCGDISKRRVAPALRDLDNCQLVSVNRKDYAQAEEFATEFGAQKWTREWQEMLDDENIDAVYVATPVYLHAEQTIAAARAGKHILCEKPMAMNAKECTDMIEAARTNNVKLGIAYYRHFYPVIQRTKELIAKGEIGKIVMVQINASSRFDASPGEPRHWLLVKEQSGGGPMMDFGCHRIEVFLNVVGPIEHSHSIVNNLLFQRQVEDTATALFEFENGAHGFLSAVHSAFEPKDTLHIYGTTGTIYIDCLNTGEMRIVTEKGERIENWPPHANLHLPLINDFARAVLDNRAPGVTGEDARAVTLVLGDIYRNASSK